MTEIERLLNPLFLIRLVSIENINYYSNIDSSNEDNQLTSVVELKVMVIEPDINGVQRNNFYKLTLLNVNYFSSSHVVFDENSYIFDTDEVTLDLKNSKIGEYRIKFRYANVLIEISFKNIEMIQSNT